MGIGGVANVQLLGCNQLADVADNAVFDGRQTLNYFVAYGYSLLWQFGIRK